MGAPRDLRGLPLEDSSFPDGLFGFRVVCGKTSSSDLPGWMFWSWPVVEGHRLLQFAVECVCLTMRARDWLRSSPMLAWRVRRPCSYRCRREGAFNLWHCFVPERCAETVRRATHWCDGPSSFAITVIATAPTSGRSGVSLVRFFFLWSEVTFALVAEFSEAVCGGGRISGGAWGDAVATGGLAIGKCLRNTCARVP